MRLNHASQSGRRTLRRWQLGMGSLRTLRCPRTLALNLPPLSLSNKDIPIFQNQTFAKMSEELSEIGLIGLAVMGQTSPQHCRPRFAISVYNLTSKLKPFWQKSRYGGLLGCIPWRNLLNLFADLEKWSSWCRQAKPPMLHQ